MQHELADLQKSEVRRIDITKKALFSLFVDEICQLIDIRISGNDDWENILVAFDETVEYVLVVTGHRAKVWRKRRNETILLNLNPRSARDV
jgi:hypothetical protein